MKYIKVSDNPARYVDFGGIRALMIDTLDTCAIYGECTDGRTILVVTCADETAAEETLGKIIEQLNGGN